MSNNQTFQKQIHKKHLFSEFDITLIVLCIGVMLYVYIKYDDAWSNYGLLHASLALSGFIGSNILSNGTILPLIKKSFRIESFTIGCLGAIFIFLIHIVANTLLDISLIDKAFYYIFAAISEEIFFRCFIILIFSKFETVLTTPLFKLISIIVSALSFMFIHFNYYGNEIAQLIVFFSGIVLALIFVQNHDITSCFIAHMINNLFVVGYSIIYLNLSSYLPKNSLYAFIIMILLFIVMIWIFILIRKTEKSFKKRNFLIGMFLLCFIVEIFCVIYSNIPIIPLQK